MASNNNNNDRPNNLPYTTSSRRGPSKAQLSLQKILLNPISSTPPPYQFRQVHNASSSASSTSLSVLNVPEYDSVPMGYNLLDLNLPPPPETHEDSPSPPLHGAEKVQECNLKSPEDDNGTSMLQDGSFVNEMEMNNLERVAATEAEIKKGSEREENKTEIRFGALLDAVECAMEEEYGGKAIEPTSKGEEEKNELNGRKRQRMKWKTEKEEVEVVVTAIAAEEVSTSSPVVKSNRGRTQVLPCKYRDSVIEPLTHLSSRHSRSSSTFGPTRRRSK